MNLIKKHILFSLLLFVCVCKPLLAEQSIKNQELIDEKSKYLDEDFIVIGSGPVNGVYYPTGSSICRIINMNSSKIGTRCAVETTSGSIYNVKALKEAEVDLAIMQSDWQREAYYGTGPFKDIGRLSHLRYLFSVHNEAFTVIVRNHSSIRNINDLKGKVISVGNKQSGTRATMNLLMKFKGWTIDDFKAIREVKAEKQAEALCNREVDAIVSVIGHPNGLVQDITGACETRILDAVSPDVQRFLGEHSEYTWAIIPGGMYKGSPEMIRTFGPRSIVVTTTEMSDKLAYDITKNIFTNVAKFQNLHPVFKNLKAEEMVGSGRSIPFHSGALKFYKEAGYINNDSKQPEGS